MGRRAGLTKRANQNLSGIQTIRSMDSDIPAMFMLWLQIVRLHERFSVLWPV